MPNSCERALDLCAQAIEILKQDSVKADVETSSKDFKKKTTVGLMLSDNKIDAMVFGGPAYSCGKLSKGDIILKVDGHAPTLDTLPDLLIGDDVPGSIVKLTVLKQMEVGPVEKEVTLQRMASDVIADRRKMFELFTVLKERATKNWDTIAGETTDECIDLWTKMLIASGKHDEMIAQRSRGLLAECTDTLLELQAVLMRLNQSGRDEKEREEKERLQRERAAPPIDHEAEIADLQSLLRSMVKREELAAVEIENERLRLDLKTIQQDAARQGAEVARLKKLMEGMVPAVQYESSLDDVKRFEAEVSRLQKALGAMTSKVKLDEAEDEVKQLTEELLRTKRSLDGAVSKARFDEALMQLQLLSKDCDMMKQRLQITMKASQELLLLQQKLGEAGLADPIVLDRFLKALTSFRPVEPMNVIILLEKLCAPPEISIKELLQLLDVIKGGDPVSIGELMQHLVDLQGPPNREFADIRRILRTANDPKHASVDEVCRVIQMYQNSPDIDLDRLEQIMKISLMPENWLGMMKEVENLRIQLGSLRALTSQLATGNKVGGLGLLIEGREDGYFSVVSMTAGGVADKCGKIRVGDMLVSVDEQDVQGFTSDNILGLIAGAEGSKVDLCLKGASDMRSDYRINLTRSAVGFQGERYFEVIRKICIDSAISRKQKAVDNRSESPASSPKLKPITPRRSSEYSNGQIVRDLAMPEVVSAPTVWISPRPALSPRGVANPVFPIIRNSTEYQRNDMRAPIVYSTDSVGLQAPIAKHYSPRTSGTWTVQHNGDSPRASGAWAVQSNGDDGVFSHYV